MSACEVMVFSFGSVGLGGAISIGIEWYNFGPLKWPKWRKRRKKV